MTARHFIRNGGDGALLLLSTATAALYVWPNGLTVSMFVFAFGCVGLALQV